MHFRVNNCVFLNKYFSKFCLSCYVRYDVKVSLKQKGVPFSMKMRIYHLILRKGN